MSNVISGRAYYKKDDGTFGIWWCDKHSKWYIAPVSYKGLCGGYIVSREVDPCVHNVGSTWEYFDFDQSSYFKAGEGLLVSCLRSGEESFIFYRTFLTGINFTQKFSKCQKILNCTKL